MKKIFLYFLLVLVIVVLIPFANLIVFGIKSKKISEGTPIPKYINPVSALIIIDVQGGTTGETSIAQSYIEQAPMLIDNINRLIDSALRNRMPIIYVVNAIDNPLVNILNSTMAMGTAGAAPDQRLKIASDYLVTKQKNDAFSNPTLDSLLIKLQVDHLFIAGLDACHCVNGTVQGALNRGYKITAVANCIIASNDSLKQVQMTKFEEAGISIQVLQ